MDAATAQLAAHVVDRHAEEVDADVPEGMVQVRRPDDGEWVTMTPAAARALQRDDDPSTGGDSRPE